MRALVPVLLHPNPEASAEAARAFGNLSRLASARTLMCAAQVRGPPPTLALIGSSTLAPRTTTYP